MIPPIQTELHYDPEQCVLKRSKPEHLKKLLDDVKKEKSRETFVATEECPDPPLVEPQNSYQVYLQID